MRVEGGIAARPATDSRAEDHTLACEQARRAAGALHIADGALSEIHQRLLSLEALLPPPKNVRRLSPQVIVSLQVEIDSAVEAIEHIVESTKSDDRLLLRGGWSATLLDMTGSPPRTIQLASMHPESLGKAPHGSLASIAARGVHALRGGRSTVVRAIVHAAAALVAQERHLLADFLDEAVCPLLAAAEVLAENVAAHDCVLEDPGFAVQTSQVTRTDAFFSSWLAAVQDPPSSNVAGSPGMRLVDE